MKKAVVVPVAVVLTVWISLVLLQICSEDPEPNAAASEKDPEPIHDPPESIVSDPEMLVEQPFKISETARADNGTPLQNAPFFIQLSDGRYAFGYTDKNGETIPIFTPRQVPHEVYFYEEAWSRLNAMDRDR